MQAAIDRWQARLVLRGMSALIFGLVLACYWPALKGGFVWDDAAHVTRPDLESLAGLKLIWTDPRTTQQYYPVLHSAFWIEHRLWGDAELGYHLVNVILHATSCCLLALALRRLWDTSRAAVPPGAEWVAAAIFAVHPVCVESVAWISEQKNTLSLVFYFLAVLAYLDFAAGRKAHLYFCALGWFLLALGTKSVTATLPAALLLVLWWRNGRLSVRRDVLPLAPWFVLALASGLGTAWVERKLIGAEGAAFDLSVLQHLQLAGRMVWYYFGKLVWPTGLTFVYPHWDVPTMASGWTLYLVGLVAVTAALWAMRRRSRGLFTSWLFFLGSLFPALGFFNVYPFIFSYVADHFQYLPCLGIIVPAAVGLTLIVTRSGAPATARSIGTIGWAVCAMPVLVLAVLANRQSATYRDGETLYRATLAQNPACWMAHNNLAVALVKSPAGVPEALGHFEEALRLRPDYADAHNNYANQLASLPGRMPEALAHFEQALQIDPDFVEAHVSLASVLVEVPGLAGKAAGHYAKALQLRPNDPAIHYMLANALAKIPGRLPEALAHYGEALRLNPGYAEAEGNLAKTLASLPGRQPEALAHYEKALRLNPNLAKVHYDLACELSDVPGREAEAIAQYEEALRLRPDYAQAHNNLAISYVRQGRWPEARKHWERALELAPDYEDARRNLELLESRGK